MESVRKYGNIKLLTTESKRHYLVSEPKKQKKMFYKFIRHRNEKKNTNIHE